MGRAGWSVRVPYWEERGYTPVFCAKNVETVEKTGDELTLFGKRVKE